MPYYTVPLIVATLASGATAALFHWQLTHYRSLTKSLLRREKDHLDTIFSLQRQLTDAKRVQPNR